MFTLQSSAVENGGMLPEKYAEKSLLSPPLEWNDVPEGTQSLALAMTDPDLPEQFKFPRVFVHWMVYNISPETKGLPEGASPAGNMPSGVKELNSDFVTFGSPAHKNHYAGPWPPDRAHRYVFTVYALKTAELNLPENADYVEFVKAVLPVTIASATLVVTYGPAKEPLPGT
jgi:ribose transport system ATP-binding protein